jgi:LEA14-like dessication related protein
MKNIFIYCIIIVTTVIVTIKAYEYYVYKPKLEIVNIFWSDYVQVYEDALATTLKVYADEDAAIMVQEQVNQDIQKLVKELEHPKN